MLPAQTEGLVPKVIVGFGIMVMVIGWLVLAQPATVFDTVNVALYVPTPAAPGTVIPIWVAGSAIFTTSKKPAASAAALKSMLY